MASFDVLLIQALNWGVLALAVWALIDALIRPATGYAAVGRLTKPIWIIFTGLAVLFGYLAARFILPPFHFLWLLGAVAAIVYLVDMRPKLRQLRGGKNNNIW